MQTILFYEERDPTQVAVASFDAEKPAWRETVLKQNVEAWLKENIKNARIDKRAKLLVVLPETVVRRCRPSVPLQGKAHERRAMAENALMIALNEQAALLRTVPYEKNTSGQETQAVSGVAKSTFQAWQAVFGSFGGRVQWVSAIECALAFCDAPVNDGIYNLEAPLWTAVFAIKNGVVLNSAATEGRDFTTLLLTVFEATKDVGLAPTCTTLYMPNEATLHEGMLTESTLKKTRHARMKVAKTNRPLMALLLGCVILPGLLWLALQAHPVPLEETTEEEAMRTVVTKSHYSTLIEGAYQAKSERITILSQEASEGALAIHGRCSEVLDLADYMRRLDEAEAALHPLLLDLAKKTADDRYYYEFVVEISLDGRVTP